MIHGGTIVGENLCLAAESTDDGRVKLDIFPVDSQGKEEDILQSLTVHPKALRYILQEVDDPVTSPSP